MLSCPPAGTLKLAADVYRANAWLTETMTAGLTVITSKYSSSPWVSGRGKLRSNVD